MVSMAKIAREDRNMTQDDERVWEEMMQVMELETDIANVSTCPQQEWNGGREETEKLDDG